jgi:hypothetical protein
MKSNKMTERVHEVNYLKSKILESESYRTVKWIFIKQLRVRGNKNEMLCFTQW